MAELLLQFLITGLTVGSIYALIALGFTIVYNATEAINFAQGEFVMLGGMTAVALNGTGLPMPLVFVGSVAFVTLVGLLMERLMLSPMRRPTVTNLIIVTIGASILLKGTAMLAWGKDGAVLPAFTGDTPIRFFGAVILPQALWIMASTLVVVLLVRTFFQKTAAGMAMRAAAANGFAASLVGINTKSMRAWSFALAAAVGSIAGILITPITLTQFDRGTMLGLKGFCAAIIGGLGNGPGAVAGGLLLGVLESLGAGYISSGYKDAIAFVLLILVLLLRPQGLLGTPPRRKA
ncbi:MAG TPA: branched-chain amino acid ABC transporter permease [Burkholderiaceae bacterium]|nr:branched-chain amino acid ABC transporter permease [Burkholderiaceae bacterium]